MNQEKNDSLPTEKKFDDEYSGNIKHDFKIFFRNLYKFLVSTLSIRDGADIQGTIDGIKRDMVFRGPTVWILVASIFIASIGLNINSTAVIIGAMLISPLMGPILSIGLAIGTYDWNLLLRSLKNYGIMVGIAILTSTVYFLITPLTDAQPELLARTKPTSLDVFIAIFGGLAGIVAGSRREKSNVIPGVAIATALMPPLCTAGYGIASGQMNFFFGAFYLFFLNTVFIALSTIIVVRYLHFPIVNIVEIKREKQIRKYMLIFAVIVILPSAKIFWDVIRESRFKVSADHFIQENINFKGSEIINKQLNFNDTLSSIDLYVIGEKIEPELIEDLNRRLENYGLVSKGGFWKTGHLSPTKKTVLKIHQSKEDYGEIDSRLSTMSKEIRVGILEDIYKKNEQTLQNKEKKIQLLEDELIKLKIKDTIPFSQINKELRVQFDKVTKFAYAPTVESAESEKRDTIPTFLVKWDNTAWRNLREKQAGQMEKWLKVRLQLDTVRVIQY